MAKLEIFANYLAKGLHIEKGNMLIDKFPDKESYIRINSKVKNKVIILFCTLNNPDRKIIIASGSSMLAILQQLVLNGSKNLICLAVHPLLNNKTKNNLLLNGCNTVRDSTNRINILNLISNHLNKLLDKI